jgi:hypothetical protein
MVILPHRRKAFRTTPESGGGGGDPYWNQVVLSLHCDGTNGSTTIVDSSNSAKTVTAAGNAQITTTNPKFGTGAMLFDGTGDYATVPSSDDFTFGTGDFTFEAWIRFPTGIFTGVANQYGRALFDCRPGAVQGPYMAGGLLTNRTFAVSIGTNGAGIVALYSTTVLNYDTWHHVAITRSGTTARLFIDGTIEDTETSSLNITQTVIALGYNQFLSGLEWKGSMDEIRVTKGVARYTSNFTPPTQAFPDFLDESVDPYFENVVLSLHCEGTDGSTSFVDSSSYSHTVSVGGNANIDTSEQKYGTASAHFDGTADWLEVGPNAAFALGTQDFTYEFWVYLVSKTSSTTSARLASGNGFDGILMTHTARLGLYITGKGTSWDIFASANAFDSIVTGSWHHVAITRSGTSFRGFVNGTQVISFSSSSAIYQSSNLVRIAAANSTGGFAMNGWQDDIRLTVGVARYTSSFTPPTQAFPDS